MVAHSTPSLGVDQALAMETIEKEEQGKSSQKADRVLRKWCFEHFSQPYPNKQEKEQLCTEAKITTKKLNEWLSNWRKRILGPNTNTKL